MSNDETAPEVKESQRVAEKLSRHDLSSREIVRRSGSNLAFALAILPRRRRRDMEIFYAFCRAIDDWVDEPGLELEDRCSGLDRWRSIVEGRDMTPAARVGVEQEFSDLIARLDLNRRDLGDILDGMEMDLHPQSFATVEELRLYCYRVASAVGLVSTQIFGCTHPLSRSYAEQLGYALQWTNILRDVAEDARRGRVMLPLENLARFDLDASTILSLRPDPGRFSRAMRFEASIARAHYREASSIFAALPRSDQLALRSAELMRRIYSGILDLMERDGYRVYDLRYRLPRSRMIGEFLRAKLTG